MLVDILEADVGKFIQENNFLGTPTLEISKASHPQQPIRPAVEDKCIEHTYTTTITELTKQNTSIKKHHNYRNSTTKHDP